jgi:hypothetical protein
MPPVGFESTISVLERAKTVRALDRSATAIGTLENKNGSLWDCNLSIIIFNHHEQDAALQENVRRVSIVSGKNSVSHTERRPFSG